ncbi:ABC transporter permease [Geodermatophilus marinus]|uniref:ABC transporter permease n=1 Tax=Geodermatophilus sp. LHW52908 TaxID=2303986 RepID=UPI000E3DBFFB|nr:ABC transporter permease [Geodermatophilus sp. LHW52908]RFU20742.1 ABC transporter permease [Geodermatophilus sp. LHW52908]
MLPRPARRPVNVPLLLAVVLLGTLTAMALVPDAFTDADPRDCSLADSLRPPSREHPFGFDLFGCDYAARTVHGTRTSLLLAAAVVAGTALLALVVGTLAGYAGGVVDALVSRVTDVWSGIPIVLGGLVLLSVTQERGLVQVVVVLTVFSWPPMVRVMRAATQRTKELDFVTAARALGVGRLRLVRRHVLPSALRPLAVFASGYAGVLISTEAILTFAGVGLQRPAQSWGIQLQQAQERVLQAPHLLVFPGLFLVAAVLGCVLLGEGLRARSPGRR